MKCSACGHDRNHRVVGYPGCTWDIMYESAYRPHPFFLQCWCDGKSGPVVLFRGKRLRPVDVGYRPAT